MPLQVGFVQNTWSIFLAYELLSNIEIEMERFVQTTKNTLNGYDLTAKGLKEDLGKKHSFTKFILFSETLSNLRNFNRVLGEANYLEPFAKDHPAYGLGGATQVIIKQPVLTNKIVDLKTGKVIFQRK